MPRPTAFLTLLLLAGLASCRESKALRASSSPATTTLSTTATQAAYVDTVVSRDDALRRFRADLPLPLPLHKAPVALSGEYESREALVRQLVHIIEQSDTLAIEPLVINRAEFAHLYYPDNPLSRPPYDLSPGLMWFQLQESNRKAALTLLGARGGAPLGYTGHACASSERQGANTIWSACEVARRSPDGEVKHERLFGTIIERDGHFKFVGLRNEL